MADRDAAHTTTSIYQGPSCIAHVYFIQLSLLSTGFRRSKCPPRIVATVKRTAKKIVVAASDQEIRYLNPNNQIMIFTDSGTSFVISIALFRLFKHAPVPTCSNK